MKFRIVADHHIVKNCFQIPQLDFHRGTVVVRNKLADLLLACDVDIVDNYLFHRRVQIGDSLVDDAVHQHHIQQFGGAVYQVGDIDRHRAQPAVGDGPLPEGVQGVLIL